MFGSKKRVLPIAIDVGASSVKMLQLEQSGDQMHVVAAGKFVIPPHVRQSDEQQELVINAVKDLLKSEGFKGRRAVTIVPNYVIQFKSFRVPRIPDEELDQIVLFEAQDRFAFEDPTAEFRYFNAGEVRQGEEIRQEVITMGCPGERLNEHLNIFEKLNLSCHAIEVSPCAVVRSQAAQQTGSEDEDAIQIYADVGQHATRVVITRGPKIIFIKSINVGGNKLDVLTAKQLNLPVNEASQLRSEVLRHYAQPDAEMSPHLRDDILDSTAVATKQAFESIGKEIGLCLRYFSVTFRGLRPDELICVGGEAYDPGLLKSITEIAGIRAVKGSPLKNISTEGVFSSAQRQSKLLEWSTAVGLALRELSLPIMEKATT